MSKERCRWGILGTAGIARKNWQAIRNSGNGQLVAVGSRTEERAKEYIAENQSQIPHDTPPKPIAGYDAMIASDDIDALYIPLPTAVRKSYVLKAAAAGKHVLCEKPCGVDAAHLQEMIDACASAGVQFMDGVMFMHSDRMPALRAELDAGDAVGEIKRIATQFSFKAPDDFFEENIRVNSKLEPLGSLGDLGWYCIRIILWTLNYEMPVSLTAKMIRQSDPGDGSDPVPVSLSAELLFEGGITGGFYCSFETEHQQWVNISGSRGHIAIPDFVLPYHGSEVGFDVEQAQFDVDLCNFHMERHTRRVAVEEYSDSHATSQEAKLFRRFGELVLGGEPNSHWPEISLKTQQVMDACFESARNDGQRVKF